MNHPFLVSARSLPNDELVAQVQRLASRERGAAAELVAHLAELEARDLHMAAGYTSLFSYCCDVLLLSEDEACNRIAVARAARRFPAILDLLTQGVVSLTTVRLLAPHLTADNYVAVLESARGLRRPQVNELVARLAPRPDVPTSIRKLPEPAVRPWVPPSLEPTSAGLPAASVAPPPCAASDASSTLATPAMAMRAAVPPAAVPPAVITRPAAAVSPLSPDRYKLQLTISGDLLEKLRMARDLLSHAVRPGDEAAILERALDSLLTELLKKKFAATDRPRPGRPGSFDSRHVPAEVKRTVYRRDGGRCTFVAANGRRCEERALLQFHHVDPYAHGGPPTVSNIVLRCGPHNRHEWRHEVAQLRRIEQEWLLSRMEGERRHAEPRTGRSRTDHAAARFARPDTSKRVESP